MLYHGVKRYSGDEYVTHPLNTAIILAEMEADISTILSGLLCDVFCKGNVSEETLNNQLPSEVRRIVMELKNFDPHTAKFGVQEEVVMVKLAERLHNMRTIKFMDEKTRHAKAKETLEIFMPIARKLENQKLIEELNDLSLDSFTGE